MCPFAFFVFAFCMYERTIRNLFSRPVDWVRNLICTTFTAQAANIVILVSARGHGFASRIRQAGHIQPTVGFLIHPFF